MQRSKMEASWSKSLQLTKRKPEQLENIPENILSEQPSPPKKSCTRGNISSTVNKTDVKIRTALPRFQSKIAKPQQKELSAATSTAASSTESLVTTTYSFASTDRLEESHDSAAADIIRSIREIQNAVAVDKIFDELIIVSDEKIAQIVGTLKVKSGKWDFKEKEKRSNQAIKDMKDCLQSLSNDVKGLRQRCVSREQQAQPILSRASNYIHDAPKRLSALQASEASLKKQLMDVRQELREATDAANSFKRENSPLRNKAKEFEARQGELSSKAATEAALREKFESDAASLKAEIKDLRKKLDDNLEKYLLESKQLESAHKEEMTNVRVDLEEKHKKEMAEVGMKLGRRESDVQRSYEEKEESNKLLSQLRDEVTGLKSQITRLEFERETLTAKASTLTESLAEEKRLHQEKDAELRSSTNSSNEMQKIASDERIKFLLEINTLTASASHLDSEKKSLLDQLSDKREEALRAALELATLRNSLSSLETKLNDREIESVAGKEAVKQLEVEREVRACCEAREAEARRELIASSSQLIATQTEINSIKRDADEKLERTRTAMTSEIEALTGKIADLVEEKRSLSETATRFQSESENLRRSLEHASANHEAMERNSQLSGEIEVLRQRLREAQELKIAEGANTAERVKELEEQVRNGEVQRRKLHNLVQELRGNVRVFARVRPFLPSDGIDLNSVAGAPSPCVSAKGDGNGVRILRPGGDDASFSFDRSFGPSCSQENVFQEVSEFVQSALDGYNVCLFSYGQTGSGKTHTMQGSGNGSQRGIIPRAVQQVGLYKNELETKGWEYRMEVSFIEIYNESIRDLLRNGPSDENKHEIKRDTAGNTTITDLTLVEVGPNNTEQMDGIIELAARHRSVERTAMNERSSRSHSIFTLYLRATNKREGSALKGTLHLVDLAGSERLDRSEATGARLKETVAINKSLSSLVDVFTAIGNKQSHIPFRNSKLTYLLQPALSGDGKTLMMINLSPTEESFNESLCTLRFAKQVNQCELGKPKRQLKDAPAVSADNGDSASVTSASSSSSSVGSYARSTSSSAAAAGGGGASSTSRKK